MSRGTGWWCATAGPEPRVITTAAGPIEVEAPRVNDKRVDDETGERCRFRSQILAAVVPQEPEGGRGAAVDVPARDALGRLRARRWPSSSAPPPGCRRR